MAWVIFDLHGSVAALCTAGGVTLTDAYRYDGFGQTIATFPSSSPTDNPWKYRGLLGIDPSAAGDQLYDMVARDYRPASGTFTQLDSVQGSAANPVTMNRYLYALANPTTLIDPDGHLPAPPCSDCPGYDSDKDKKLWQEKQQKAKSGGAGTSGPSSSKGNNRVQAPSGAVELKELAKQHLPDIDKNYAVYVGDYSLCAQGASGIDGGHASSHLLCLQNRFGIDVGLAVFLYYYQGEYDRGADAEFRQGAMEAINLIGLMQLLRVGANTLKNRVSFLSGAPSSGLTFSDRQLQSNLAQHGPDFGFDPKLASNAAARKEYMSALVDIIDAPATIRIEGTYGLGNREQAAVHHLDVASGRNIVFYPEGGFWTAWKLDADQLWYVLTRGSLV